VSGSGHENSLRAALEKEGDMGILTKASNGGGVAGNWLATRRNGSDQRSSVVA
jgi:hypothetical protein